MKRVLKFLARLYPAAWRNRYGAEYEALLDEQTPRARDVFDVFWSSLRMHYTSRSLHRIVLPCALAGTLAALAISFARPDSYKSQTLISVTASDPQSANSDFFARLQDLLAQPFLASIIQKDNLYPRDRARMPLNDVVALMRKNIEVLRLQTKDGKPASAFLLQFLYPDPHVAQRVNADLVSGLIGMNLRAAINNSSASPRRQETFTVLAPATLPKKPAGMGPSTLAVMGLLAGLLGGFLIAACVGSLRAPTVAKG